MRWFGSHWLSLNRNISKHKVGRIRFTARFFVPLTYDLNSHKCTIFSLDTCGPKNVMFVSIGWNFHVCKPAMLIKRSEGVKPMTLQGSHPISREAPNVVVDGASVYIVETMAPYVQRHLWNGAICNVLSKRSVRPWGVLTEESFKSVIRQRSDCKLCEQILHLVWTHIRKLPLVLGFQNLEFIVDSWEN